MENDPSFLPDNYPKELLQQIAAGNQAAFRLVYTSYYRRLFQFALSIVKTRESAEEIVEDVFVRIWQQRDKITVIQHLRVYLYTATKNSSLNYLSRQAKASITEPFDHIHVGLGESSLTPEQILITAEIQQKIRKAVEALPPRCKMRFGAQYTINLMNSQVDPSGNPLNYNVTQNKLLFPVPQSEMDLDQNLTQNPGY